jgi:hypothetical protein
MKKCGFKWYAKLLLPGGGWKMIEQVCTLPEGHDGDHRSDTKVTCEQR